jgi:hypothetical protein
MVANPGNLMLGFRCILCSPIGFYQVTKLAIIPSLLFGNLVWKGHWAVSGKMLLSLVVLSSGLAMATVHDVTLSLASFGAGLVAVCSTCLFQTGIEQARRVHGLSSLQLQYEVYVASPGSSFRQEFEVFIYKLRAIYVNQITSIYRKITSCHHQFAYRLHTIASNYGQHEFGFQI